MKEDILAETINSRSRQVQVVPFVLQEETHNESALHIMYMYVYTTYRKTQKHGLCVELFSRALHTVHTHAHKHSLSHCWCHSFDACESRYFVQIASNEVQEITDQILGFSHVVFPSHFPLVLILLRDFIRSDSLWFWLSFLPCPSLSLSCFFILLRMTKNFSGKSMKCSTERLTS